MLDKTIDLRARRDQAGADLQAVEVELSTLDREKVGASASREAFEQWRVDHAASTAEKERLVLHIDLLEKEIARADGIDGEEDRRKQHAAKELSNAKLAQRINADLEKMNTIAENLLRDVAESAIEDQLINANLPDGLEPLVSADLLARSLPGFPRKEISRQRIWLWVRTDNGAHIGDQERVRDFGDGKGILEVPFRPAVRCTKRLFEEVAFHPAIPSLPPMSLFSIRLVQADGPNLEYDGADIRQPREVLAALNRAAAAREPRDRWIHTEIVPVGVVEE